VAETEPTMEWDDPGTFLEEGRVRAPAPSRYSYFWTNLRESPLRWSRYPTHVTGVYSNAARRNKIMDDGKYIVETHKNGLGYTVSWVIFVPTGSDPPPRSNGPESLDQ
jgi:hypothetical protein